MIVKNITNTSKVPITLKCSDKVEITLPPGAKISNLNRDVTNLDEFRGNAIVVGDLTEVVAGSGKTKLND